MDPLMITGMHRSGTSLIARFFGLCGGDLGHFAHWVGPDNPLGFWEDARLIQANETLLEEAGATWKEPVVISRDLRKEGVQVDTLLNDKFHGRPVLKDPRICFTWPTWKKAWPAATLVGVIRSPMEVIQSVRKRNPDISGETAYDLWKASNENLLKWGAIWIHFPTGMGLKTATESIGFQWVQDLYGKLLNDHVIHYTEDSNDPLYREIVGEIERKE